MFVFQTIATLERHVFASMQEGQHPSARSSPHEDSVTLSPVTSAEPLSLEVVNDNLLRLMAHLGISPSRGRDLSNASSARTSPLHQPQPDNKPICPWCKSNRFLNEKNLVQHLNHAMAHIDDAATSSKSCRFVPSEHSAMMGCNDGSGTSQSAVAFLSGYRSCFVASAKSGFDLERCATAQQYLQTASVINAGSGQAP